MSLIVTIGREFGSGGRELGRRLSEELGIAYYDQEILKEIAEKTSLSENYVREIIEKRPFASYPIHIGRTMHPMGNPIMDQTALIYQQQSETITELAEKSDCVIVGRCADYILREKNPLRIFVYADMEYKIKRCKDRAQEGEQLTDKELEKMIKTVDKNRARYYDFYTGNDWGDRRNYDICINTTNISIKDCAHALAQLIKTFA